MSDSKIVFGIVFVLCVAWATPTTAQEYEPEQPDSEDVSTGIEWNDSTRLALGQCLVAEARWRNRTEHSAIMHVLEKRWRRYNEHHADAPITFEAEVRQYCHVHRVPQEESSNGWALNLPWGPMVEDADPTVRVGQWADDWDYVRDTVTMFEHGELPDPMPLAMVFGGAMDGVNGRALVYLGPYTRSIVDEEHQRVLLHNRFYALVSAVRHAASALDPHAPSE